SRADAAVRVVQPCFVVAPQSAIRPPEHTRLAIAFQHPTQRLANHLLHLRRRQRGGLDFFPAWLPVSGTRSPRAPRFDDGAIPPRSALGSRPSPLRLSPAVNILRCDARL